MKKPLFYFVLLSSIYMNAQTTIVEEKFEKDNTPMRYHYLTKSDKIVIEKGGYVSMSINRRINNISSYDSNGKKEILADNFETAESTFSITENTFQLVDFTKFSGAKTYKYVVDGKETPSLNFSDQRNSNHRVFRPQFFNDKYELGFTDEKFKNSINFKKDQLLLDVTDIFTKNNKRISIEKPEINRLIGDGFIKADVDLGFVANIVDNEKFEIITKSISKDYKTTILYRTNYNMEGKKLNEKSFTVNLQDSFLIYSSNDGGFKGSVQGLPFTFPNNPNDPSYINIKRTATNSASIFMDDLSINNFCEDFKTGDVYIYGLFGIKAEELNDMNSPSGYYIFKFDKTGKKIWESINKIDDVKEFNHKFYLVGLFSKLSMYNDNLLFQTGTDNTFDYVHYGYLDKMTGKILNKNKISYKEDKIYTFKGDYRAFLLSFYQYEGYKNKVFDYDGLVAIDTNKKVADYLKNIDSKNKLFFNTIISDKGIWLMESDNEKYYKVTFFKA
ncbi:hypothetical protein H4V97_001923 [Flavobacterium sp. CG_23.5]|uniref:hypothetical protein n=1 Tax=Flavobacterium sp. CG_23.5 TaxID=2760708 RepID=UPI001AE2D4FB|nr:hypothetical protein [Flavobacterium sp. CG_23.5]MBP2283605.1 hypothetical protein [Flavobacterium sp. CG_23.5]